MERENEVHAVNAKESYSGLSVAKSLRQQASESVAVTVIARRPRAIVVLLGWMGAEVGQIDQYARLYHDLNCSTVVATAPVMSVAVQNTSALSEVAVTACREAARLVRMAEMSEMGYGTVPLLFHVFGNGGALVIEQIDRLIREWVPEYELDDLKHQARASTCPIPLRRPSFKPMESMKSLPSLANTAADSEGEEDDLDITTTSNGPIIWTSPLRPRSISSLPLSKSSPPRTLSFGHCRLPEKQEETHKRYHKSRNVRRVDVERSAASSAVASPPKYNTEDRAYHGDFSLVASRLYLGSIIFDAAPYFPSLTTDVAATQAIGNPVLRMLARSAVVGAHGVGKIANSFEEHRLAVGGERVQGRAIQFWKNMEQLDLSRRHVYVQSDRESTEQLEGFMAAQKERGMNIQECKMEAMNHHERVNLYSGLLEDVLGTVAKKLPDEDEEKDGWSSDEEEEWHSARQL